MKIFRGLIGLATLIITLAAAYYFFFAPPSEVRRTHGTGDKSPAPALPPPPRDHLLPAKKNIAIIIDDIGYSLPSLEELLKIEAPLAFAVLPHSPHAGTAAAMIHRKGREILLHLPMEPRDAKKSPGPGALFNDMTEPEIRERLEENLAAVPQAVGVNNHMGSAFMENEEKLYLVLKELRKRGLFFIDSRTTAASRGKTVAIRTGIPFAARSLFLDNDPAQEVIFNNLLGSVAKSDRLSMIIIGHPYPGTVRALEKAVPLLQARGFIIVPPSDIVARPEEKTHATGFN